MNVSPTLNPSITAIQVLPLTLPYVTSETFGLTDLHAFCHLSGVITDENWEGEAAC